MHAAVAAAVAVATAVLTGALVVGDSVRGSLRDLTLQRLGRIDQALTTPQLFRAKLADELETTGGFSDHFESAMPALILQGSATLRKNSDARRSNDLDVFGVTERFWSLGRNDPRPDPGAEGVWITEVVARDLDAVAGDELIVRLPLVSDVPADSPLGEKIDTMTGRRFQIAGILPTKGLARFGLQPSQRPPRSIFISHEALAGAIDQPGQANTLLVAGDLIGEALGAAANEWLAEHFQPQLSDYGISVDKPGSGEDGLPGDYLQISSDNLVMPPVVVTAAEKAFGNKNLQRVSTYLANTIRIGDHSIPYSTVTGVESTEQLGPLLDSRGAPIDIGESQVVLNDWAAERLEAEVGNTAVLRFYEPESTHGELREREPPLALEVKAVVPLRDDDGQRTRAADPRLTPQLAGVTDQQSIADWDLPFELTETLSPEDEEYWDEHRATPKAFVSYELAEAAWASRWGSVSSLRLPVTENRTADDVESKLREAIRPAAMGFAFLPVKYQGLAAASGTTPFDGLFLGFSMFLIASAIMLLVLLFRLAMEGRASEIGLLAALGFTHNRSRQLLTGEAMCVALLGAIVGSLLGIAYAWAMITGLKTIWVEAIAAPFLELFVGPWSLAIGFTVGLAVAWVTALWTLRRVLRQTPRGLLAGEVEDKDLTSRQNRWLLPWRLSEFCLIGALFLGIWGATSQGEAQAGAFFGVGALVLAGLLGLLRRYWERTATARQSVVEISLPRLAVANLARRAGRSTLTVGLVAAASFLLLAISAFRLAPSEQGTGGYDWIATSDVPIHYNVGTAEGRFELGFRDEEEDRLADSTIESLRLHGGEDASCLNLYKTAQPRVIGVRDPARILAGFAWAAKRSEGNTPPDLNTDIGSDSAGRSIIPVVLDFNTAKYSLHLSGEVGDRLTILDGTDRIVTLQVVGLLQNSLLQGDLLISDQNFRQLYPTESGSQLFLIREGSSSQNTDAKPLDELLENRLSDYGFAVSDARERLQSFLAVQNTYLTTFQSLGGLGLLLGTIGLAVVQLRGVIERRGELALLQAVGFRRRRVIWLVLLENLILLTTGLILGGIAAAMSLLPQLGIHEAGLPWLTVVWLLALILVVGIAATWLATRGTLRQPILPALRGD